MRTDRSLPRGLTRTDVVVSLLAGIAAVIGSYALAGFTPSFVAGPIAGVLARTMPGAIVTFAIVVLGDLGELLNVAVAIGLATGLLAATSLVGVHVGRRATVPILGGVLAGLLGWLAAVAVTAAPVAAVGAGVGAGTIVVLSDLATRLAAAEGAVSPERRRLLGSLAGLVTIGAVGAAIRHGADRAPTRAGDGDGSAAEDLPGTTDADRERIRGLLADARRQSLDVAGIEPLVSERFYEVDINATNPPVDAESWRLRFTGRVEQELTVSYDDITSRPAEHRFVTLRCVGESLNGQKMDNALWTGIPVASLLEQAGPRGGCECVMLRAADGYFEEFPIAALRRGFLAYGMNGRVLPRGHGYPVRALIPGHWGEINVKWLTEVEILDKQMDGYWERRGWHGTGPVNTVAKLHAINHLGDGRVQVGGHAYAGLRGIERVDVSVDGGDWQSAALSEPLPGEDVWRQWKYEYDPPGRAHEVVVRAVDGTGTVQPREESGAFPSGPTGWVSRTVEP